MKKEILELKGILNKANTMLDELVKEEAKNLERGNIITVAGYEWIILKVEDGKAHCLLKDLLPDMQFDTNSNDYRKSSLRSYLNGEFLKKLIKASKEGYLETISTDLLSLDGQKEFGVLESGDKVGLLTVDMYRENRDIIPNADEWWWLATPWSTPCNGYEKLVCCVSSGGGVNYYFCYLNFAVRPFCIFNTLIFES